jgi:hypothetical protein
MTGNAEELELKDRLELIEQMVAQGRRSTESWGWNFVLWGVAYYVATAWATLGHSNFAWPVTMTIAGVATGVVASRITRGQPRTTLGRALGSLWSAMGISLSILLLSLATSGRYDGHVFVAIVGAMLGAAHAASSLILKWKMQLACALVWLATAIVGCFGSDTQVSIAFLGATFCQIVFGVYAMIRDARRRRQQHGVVHA